MKHAKSIIIGVLVLFMIYAIPVVHSIPVSRATPVISDWPGGLIIDHTCIDLESIPAEWIQAAQTNVRVHYAHTSHGSQITTGLTRIESADATYSQVSITGSLPTEEGALCILDGNPPHSYITPDLYWETDDGIAITQQTLDDNPTITVSMWAWCTQLNYYDSTAVQQYLDAMSALEEANPDVTFVYMTCNAQASDAEGYNRWLNNEIIREYCATNNKVLFDFADLDAWSNGEQNTYQYSVDGTTYTVPLEHEDFNGDQAGHTTYTSCEQKGRAFWWLVASLAGWNAPTVSSTGASSDTATGISSKPALGSSDYLFLGTTLGLVAVLVVVTVLYNKHLNR